jgi:class 3 adenylate cyclase/predicted ATPase
MQCQICEFTNRDGARFCEECGAGLEVVCLDCGAANSAGGRFCSACGASLGTNGAPTGVADLARDAAAERRQLTIMFCDLVGYTALSAKLDPEDLRDLIRRYQTVAAAEIRRYDGSVAKFSGDGIMAYFGFPKAHEDDAERAVLAGLAIVESVRGLHASPGHEQASGLSVRVGIATGEVVVGDLVGEGVSERWAVIGETPNLAARLQSVAEPNSVVISARTQRLARGGFGYVNLGLHELKGIPTPVEVWRVKGKKATASRFDAVHGRALTPLVGREPELALIDRSWQRASAGNGQVVLLRGEPGIGKSRITQFFCERLKGQPHQLLQYQCSSYHANSALHPVIAQIEQAAKFSPDDSNEQKCEKLDALFGFSDVERETGVPLIASLLSIPCESLYPKLMLEPGRQREKTLAVLLDRLHTRAGEAPLLCIVEDVHWIDPSTLDFLHMMVGDVHKLAVLLIVTCRPEFEAPWQSNPHVTEVRLQRFTESGVKEIVAGVTAGKALPADVMAQIVAKADGVPLFAEELTKTVLDSGLLSEGAQHYALPRTLPNLAIPATLQDSLMARLDRLPQEKSVAQLAAVIGRSFSYDLLAAVAGLPEDKLDRAIGRLQEADLIYERRPALTPTFEFKHALIQDAAYQSQLKSVRRTHHEKIARALEQRFPLIASTQPEVVAHHYGEAECVEPALKSWQAAGIRAIEHSANVEALRHFDEALRLLPHVESAEKRAQQELQVQLARGMTLTAVEGYASPSVEFAYARALALCEEVGNDQQKFAALFGLWRIVINGPELGKARALASQLLEHAERLGVTEMILTAHGSTGITTLFLGELAVAEDSFRKVIALYDPVAHHALAISAGQDPGLACMMYSALGLWLRGHTEDALAQYGDALERARALGHAFSLAYTLHVAAIIEQCMGNLPKLWERATELKQLAADSNFAQLHAGARVYLGYCDSEQGGGAGSLEEIAQGIQEWQKSSGLNVPFFKAMLGHACGKSGDLERGLATLDEAMALADATHMRWYGAELCRLKGEMLAQRSNAPERDVVALFSRAVAIASEQGAASLEKKARDSLASWTWRQARPVSPGVVSSIDRSLSPKREPGL